MTRNRGFTLVELMIALVVAAILISIAVPSYRRYIIRSQRTDAISALTRIQAAQEKYFLQNNAYAQNLEQLGLAELSDGGFYDVRMPAPDDVLEFSAFATPRAGTGQIEDKECQRFEIDHTGVKRTKDNSGADSTKKCWR
jgi:type IV pilus assembly protein PilE